MKNLLITLVVTILLISVYHNYFSMGIGAVSFPTSLDTFTNPTATTRTNVLSHADQHSDANDGIEVLQTKVGADGSAVTTTHDYKLSGVTGSDVACSLTGIETLTNKTLTSPTINSPSITNLIATISAQMASTTLTGTTTINTSGLPFSLDLGSDATGDVFYRNSSGNFMRLPIGTSGYFLTASSTGLPAWVASTPSQPTLTWGVGTTTQEITTDGSELIVVYVMGILNDTSPPSTVAINYDGVSQNSVQLSGAVSDQDSYSLMWASTTPNQTVDITLTATNGTIETPDIFILKF